MRDRLSAITAARLRRFLGQETGQDLMEYGLLVSLIATLLVGSLTAAGDTVENMWSTIVAAIRN